VRGQAVKQRIRSTIRSLAESDGIPPTRRAQLVALSELARRVGGDVPTGGRELDLALYELKVFSQNGEDGVLAEIIRRTGAPGRWFVEFGTGAGVESNCALLADVLGWSGLFMEGGDAEYTGLARKYSPHPRVATRKAMITPENVEQLFAAEGVPPDLDVLSIDVDGSDYWIWEALDSHRPRVVVIEYNGSLEPGRRLVQPRDTGPWRQTDFYGASIDALVELGTRKGYRHVHCDLTGNNAFFVRDDLPGDYLEPALVPRRAANFGLAGASHVPDLDQRIYVDLGQAHSEP